MKLIIAGTRTLTVVADEIFYALGSAPEITEVVSGGCRGIDLCGEEFANDYEIPIKRFNADWDKHGKGAGPIRNKEMAEYADALLLVWDRKSRGSKSMKAFMTALGKPIYQVVK